MLKSTDWWRVKFYYNLLTTAYRSVLADTSRLKRGVNPARVIPESPQSQCPETEARLGFGGKSAITPVHGAGN